MIGINNRYSTPKLPLLLQLLLADISTNVELVLLCRVPGHYLCLFVFTVLPLCITTDRPGTSTAARGGLLEMAIRRDLPSLLYPRHLNLTRHNSWTPDVEAKFPPDASCPQSFDFLCGIKLPHIWRWRTSLAGMQHFR